MSTLREFLCLRNECIYFKNIINMKNYTFINTTKTINKHVCKNLSVFVIYSQPFKVNSH